MVNATVSHELRNPLNSLIAINVEKRYLYKQLHKVLLGSGTQTKEQREAIDQLSQ